MQREIKFRVFQNDKQVKRMIYPKDMVEYVELCFAPHLDGTMSPCFLTADCKVAPQRFTLMQYTGLMDKNGKEIYESDRVKTPAGIGVVRWDRCFRLFWNDRDSTTLHDCIEEQLEVVGNIYEHSHLLSNK